MAAPEGESRREQADAQMTQGEQRVTPLELFFDLVFVYAVTQVTTLMARDPTWAGIGRGLLMLAASWWAWTGYAWLTNVLEPEDHLVRAGMFAAMTAMLVAALAIPGAFGPVAVLFGVAYLLVRLINVGLFAIAGRHDPDFRRALHRFAPTALTGSILIFAAGFFDGGARIALWLVAILALYSGLLIAGMRGWHIPPAHFAERYGLVVIIALGESIVAIRFATAGTELAPGVIAAACLGLAVVAALWWAYFDVFALLAEHQLAMSARLTRAHLARDYYAYLHLPMIAGVVLFALGLELAVHDVMKPLAVVPAVALCGGLSLYFFTHVAMRGRLVYLIRRTTSERPRWISPGRLATAIATMASIPLARTLSALGALALVALLCWALIVWDVVHYRDLRLEVRASRR